MHGRVQSFTVGHPTLFTKQQEKLICNTLIVLADAGMPLDDDGIKRLISSYCIEIGQPDLFINRRPSTDWIKAFHKRWKGVLGKRRPESIEPLRMNASKLEIHEQFYKLLG